MTKATNYLPTGAHNVTPHLVLKNVSKALEFYKKAFGAQELARMPLPDGRIMHACIQIGDSRIMFADEFPERSCGHLSPETIKGTHATVHLYVENVDEVFQRAIDAGAKAEMAPQDMFWGDRYARIIDPFGQPWSIATHIEDLSAEEIQKRGAECMKQMAPTK